MLAWTIAHFRFDSSREDGKAVWPPHVWLGVSIENQSYTRRIKHLQRTPALTKFLSIEPMLGHISLDSSFLETIQWIIVGGESGPRARLGTRCPFHYSNNRLRMLIRWKDNIDRKA
jgi:hypothetical protein